MPKTRTKLKTPASDRLDLNVFKRFYPRKRSLKERLKYTILFLQTINNFKSIPHYSFSATFEGKLFENSVSGLNRTYLK
jgi:hypothetical protein